MKSNRTLGAVAVLAMLTLGLACERAFMADPAAAGGKTTVALSLTAAGSAGGPSQAFDKADQVWIRVSASNAVRLETTLPIQAAGQDIPLSLEVPLEGTVETLLLEAELRSGASALFRGAAPLELQAGPSPEVALTLEPVVGGLELGASLPTLTAYGDSVLAGGALVFATGDTVSSTSVSWISLNPSVVAILGGVPVARADGEARLVGTVGALTDTTTVRVQAVVTTVTVQPNSTLMGLGTTRQYTAVLTDRRGNPLSGRPVTWASSNPAVIQLGANGMASAINSGSSIITATSGTASGNLSVQVRAIPPEITTESASGVSANSAVLNATVQPNGLPTSVWFDYSTSPSFSEFSTTPVINVPAGDTEVPAAIAITSMSSLTQYYVRAHAQSQGGSATGGVTSFTTIAPFQVSTGPATEVSCSSATLTGSVTTGEETVRAWFEWWSQDSTPSQPKKSQEVTLPPSQTPIVMPPIQADTLDNFITYYYRLVAVSFSDVRIEGATRTFFTGCAEAPEALLVSQFDRRADSVAGPSRRMAPAQ